MYVYIGMTIVIDSLSLKSESRWFLASVPNSQKSNARENKPFYGIYLELEETIEGAEAVDDFKFVKLRFLVNTNRNIGSAIFEHWLGIAIDSSTIIIYLRN